MPTKSGQTLGVIGGIVVGQAAVEAGFASQVLIVLFGISAIALNDSAAIILLSPTSFSRHNSI
jgi:Bacillus/Clostridium GerA spore germination protein